MRRVFWRRGEYTKPWGMLLGLLVLACFASRPARAQLDASCTVSILNRTAQAQPDGSWRIDNVPANFGPVRARATCVRNGLTISGQSDYFGVQKNTITGFNAKIVLGSVDPIPAALTVTSPAATLTPAQTSVQLSVTATYPDGTTADVTAASAGTTYTISNPAVATLGPNGLLTALTSGNVLVSATKDGALGLLQIAITLSQDSDGDGMPDDYEIANGLDPHNPADAFADPDHDGLTNLQEFRLGTDPHNADTDGDGLSDGDEVNIYHTNPLVFDTDGDGISDGLEVLSGSDPLDPNSFNLAPILQSLTVQPATLGIVFNTVLGEASRRLDVKARLIDGTVLDVRRRYGTTYSSSDLSVASFGGEAGVVFAGQNGTATVTVSLGSHSATVQVAVTSFSPQPLSFLLLPGFANGVDVAGTFAYVASGRAGLVVVDASNPQTPVIAATLALPGNANAVKVAGDFAYVAAGSAGLVIVDVHNTSSPVIAGRLATPGDATDLVLRDGRAYIADGAAGGLFIADVGNPGAPLRLGSLPTAGNARGVDTDGHLAVVAEDSAGLEVIDVNDPAAPFLLGATATRAGGGSHAAAVVLRGRYAYVADGASFNLGGLRTVDLSVPGTPVVVGTSSDAFSLTSLVLDGPIALTADVYFVNAVPIFNIAGTTPAFSAAVDFSRAPSFRDDNGNGIAIDKTGLVFMVGARGQITDNGTVGDTALHIGRYKLLDDTAGIPPEVSLTAPADGTTVPERNPFLARASATDDIQVASVRFLIDGVSVAEVFKSPYEVTLRAPAGVSSFTLTAVATDLGGNHTASAPVVVTVTRDDKPQVAFLAPVAGARFIEGAPAEMAATASDDVQVNSVELLVNGVSQGVFGAPPYRTTFTVPVGVPQTTLTAVATDSGGQTATATLVVPVDPVPPPTVAVLSPAAGATVTEGSRLTVTVGAVDPVGIAQVHLDANGQPVGDSVGAPYRFSLLVPAGSPALRLTATAQDTFGHTATAEIVLTVIPDPLTTVVGRVVDASGAAVAGAAVGCLGVAGTTDSAGAFSVPGVPTISGLIACGAQAAGSLGGNSASVPPVLGGTTVVGDIVISAHLLYLGSGGGSSLTPGRLLVLDDSGAGRLVEWSRSVHPQGISGLAFDGGGMLWATTQPDVPVPTLVARSRAKSTKVGVQFGTSQLLHLDPETGAVLATLGPFLLENNGTPIGLQDLTSDPATGTLYALTAGFVPREIVSLNLASQAARVLTPSLPFNASGLAAGPDGLLYLFVSGSPDNALWTVDSATGAILDQRPLTGTVGVSAGGTELGGMTLKPGTRTFVLTSPADGTALYELDLGTRAIAEVSHPAGDLAGAGLRALAFRPLGSAAGTVTTVRGLVVDPNGQPVAAADVVSLGAATTTGADGRFEMPGLTVRTGRVRVEVSLPSTSPSPLAGSSVLTPGVPPVAGGVTDLGTITLGAPACVTGSFQSNGCARGPVSGTFDLYVDDGTGQLSLVDHVLADPTGRFCAMLRRNFHYVARRQDVVCSCGTVSSCQTPLTLTDPEATGSCGDPSAACQDLGNLFLNCDFFCGS